MPRRQIFASQLLPIDLLLVAAGRPAGLDHLDGPGVVELTIKLAP